jgi:hypothetical protein
MTDANVAREAAGELVRSVQKTQDLGGPSAWSTVQGLLTAIGQETPVMKATAAAADPGRDHIGTHEALLTAAAETVSALNNLRWAYVTASEVTPNIGQAFEGANPAALDADALLTRLRGAEAA